MTLPDKSHWLPRPTRPGAWLWRLNERTQEFFCSVSENLDRAFGHGFGNGGTLIASMGGFWLPLVPECEADEISKTMWIKGVDYGLRNPKGDDCRPASTVMLRDLDELKKQ